MARVTCGAGLNERILSWPPWLQMARMGYRGQEEQRTQPEVSPNLNDSGSGLRGGVFNVPPIGGIPLNAACEALPALTGEFTVTAVCSGCGAAAWPRYEQNIRAVGGTI